MKKKFAAITILICAILLAGFVSWRKANTHEQIATRVTTNQNKRFVILTLSYNNEKFVEQNAASVLSQKYDNFRWVYYNDASTDGTAECIEKIVRDDDRVTLVHTTHNKGAMANMYEAIHALDPSDIVVILDGDDWFAHENVLAHLNEYYANSNVWMTYGQHIEYPSFTVGFCKPISKKMKKYGGFRKSKFLFSHLRTFYAGLFQSIQKEDLLYEGSFLQSGCDVATMLPMLEMAGDHAFFVRELFVIYNMTNPISDAKKNLALQQKIDQHIRSLKPYKRLDKNYFEKNVKIDKKTEA